MTWDELKQALIDQDVLPNPVEVLIGDAYVPVELAITHSGIMFFVPTVAEGEE